MHKKKLYCEKESTKKLHNFVPSVVLLKGGRKPHNEVES